jgi:peptidyl-tRNA hydrolase, PTH1 family
LSEGSVKLIAGLGNPGARYAETRHNIGFMVARRLAETSGISLKRMSYQGVCGVGRVAGEECLILLPQTFMNVSGASVASAVRSLGIALGDLLVIHDDIEIPFGTIRIRPGGGHGGHNGIRSIQGVLGSGDFIRIKVGVGRPQPEREVADYVLSPFSREESARLGRVLDNTVSAIEAILAGGIQKAMNEFNNRDISI